MTAKGDFITDDEVLERLSYHLDRHLTRLKLSRKQAAIISGEHPMSAQRIVGRVNMPRVAALFRLTQGLGIGVDELLKPIPKKNSCAA